MKQRHGENEAVREAIVNDAEKAAEFFRRAFSALTGGKAPFPWQQRAFWQLVQGQIPAAVTLPTGTGKTSLIPIWLIALAWQVITGRVSVPRRLVWVVNRRAVVDQATDEAAGLVSRLCNGEKAGTAHREILHDLRRALAQLSALGSRGIAPITVSTLRGEFADNGDWKLDPSRPAIVVGTVDMVGSRLLFSGYGDGLSTRALHAGLIGQDALVVLDEAHLTPPFAALLNAIQGIQRVTGHPRPMRVTLVSATQRPVDGSAAVGVEADDRADPMLNRRLTARKTLRLHQMGERDRLAPSLTALALAHKNDCVRVVVYVRSPKTAEEVRRGIEEQAPDAKVKVLTGTLRGFERDQLTRDPVFASFRSDPDRLPPEATHYLIATSAGEVGIDLDADHLVCDLAPIDSLIQRFGRVNRLGLGKARVDVLVPARLSDAREEATLAYLETLPPVRGGGRNVSPSTLATHPPPLEAFSPVLRIVPLARHWLDMWALTSIRDTDWPDRPEVGPWLHGVEAATPETWVAWRGDVAWLAREEVREQDCERALEACPVLTHERLREPTDAMKDKLTTLAEREGKAARRILLVRADDSLWRGTLDEATRLNVRQLHFATVLLPLEAGGLSPQGLFTPECTEPASDVAEEAAGTARRRFLVKRDEVGWAASPLTGPAADASNLRGEDLDAVTDTLAKSTRLKLLESVQVGEQREDGEDADAAWLLYFATAVESPAVSRVGRRPETLPAHSLRVGTLAWDLGEKSGLADLAPAFEWAGKTHDQGKDRRCWQQAIGNRDPTYPLAKSGNAHFNHTVNGGYRHEFGSLLDAVAGAGLAEQPWGDLALHLIASHHGHGRPQFPERTFDRERALDANRDVALEAMRRFARVQARYGWWGLAWLEALLKAADGIVSAGLDEGETA